MNNLHYVENFYDFSATNVILEVPSLINIPSILKYYFVIHVYKITYLQKCHKVFAMITTGCGGVGGVFLVNQSG